MYIRNQASLSRIGKHFCGFCLFVCVLFVVLLVFCYAFISVYAHNQKFPFEGKLLSQLQSAILNHQASCLSLLSHY